MVQHSGGDNPAYVVDTAAREYTTGMSPLRTWSVHGANCRGEAEDLEFVMDELRNDQAVFEIINRHRLIVLTTCQFVAAVSSRSSIHECVALTGRTTRQIRGCSP
jgi:hypothetical protein